MKPVRSNADIDYYPNRLNSLNVVYSSVCALAIVENASLFLYM